MRVLLPETHPKQVPWLPNDLATRMGSALCMLLGRIAGNWIQMGLGIQHQPILQAPKLHRDFTGAH